MDRRSVRHQGKDLCFDWAAYQASITNAQERALDIAAESLKPYGGLLNVDKLEHVEFIGNQNLRGQRRACQTKLKRFSCKYCKIVDNEALVIVPDCGHVVHKICMSDCLIKNNETTVLFKSCPVCKEPFTKCYPFHG